MRKRQTVDRSKLCWLSLAAVVVALDQLTKQWVEAWLRLHESVEVLPFLHLTYVRNPGAAFSFLASASGWQRWFFLGLAAAASGVIWVWLWRLDTEKVAQGVGLSLILGGAIGNGIDRARFGYVIDFVDVFYQHWHWPAFNLADAAITIGVALLMWASWRHEQSIR